MRRRIYFARVNRRADAVKQETFVERRPFRDEIEILRQSAPLRFKERRSDREWIIADLEMRGADDRYLVGLIGFTEPHTRRDFDEENLSWEKGQQYVVGGADDRVIVPFAIDMAERRRYVAYATSNRLGSVQFVSGFKRAINRAVAEHRLWPVDWDIDPITLREDIFEWLRLNPRTKVLVRRVKQHNPGGDLSDIRSRLQAISAKYVKERYAAHYNSTLDLTDSDGTPNDAMKEMTEGLHEGDVTIEIEARADDEGVERTYRSWERPHHVTVDDWGDDMSVMTIVLQQLVDFEEQSIDFAEDPESVEQT